MRSARWWVIVLVLTGSGTVHAQQARVVPRLRDVTAQAVVAEVSPGVFTYEYQVGNGASSDEGIYFWYVNIERSVGSAELSAEGLLLPQRYRVNTFAEEAVDMNVVGAVVPVG